MTRHRCDEGSAVLTLFQVWHVSRWPGRVFSPDCELTNWPKKCPLGRVATREHNQEELVFIIGFAAYYFLAIS